MARSKDYIDDEFRYDEWMKKLNEKNKKIEIKSAKQELDDLFETFGKIFGNINKSK